MNVALKLNDNRELLAKLWTVCEQLLHTDDYRSTYGELLASKLLSDAGKDQRIIDTAAGVGFPSVELFDNGLGNLFCTDADPSLLQQLAGKMLRRNVAIPVVCADWQSLPTLIHNKFDTVLCVDASIGFMDSWSSGQMVHGPTSVMNRVKEVLTNFHTITEPGGRFIVGLQKNNNKSNTDRYVMKVGTTELDGDKAEAVWDMRYDWKNRQKTWINQVEYRNKHYEQVRHSYLFDKTELAELLREIGFIDIEEIPTPKTFYEDLLVAQKAKIGA